MNVEQTNADARPRGFDYEQQAVTSMLSDIRKHPETDSPALQQLGAGLLMIGKLRTVAEARKFIEGFN